MLTKKEAEKLMKTKGEVRGVSIRDDLNFVLEYKGKQAIKELEAKMAGLGFPLKHKGIKPMDFYPIGLSIILTLTTKELFSLSDKDLEKWGSSVVKFSIFMKIFMKYFGSLKLISEQIPGMWRKHYTIGDLEISEFSEKKRYVILRLRDYKTLPGQCSIFKGYFSKVCEMVVKAPVISKETKCMFKGNKYHEFLLKW